MVGDREADQFGYQYSPISPAVGREQIVVEEEVAMLEDVKTSIPVVVESQVAHQTQPSMETKVYCRRWVMLIIFVLVFMTNAFQWIQFSIINNLITK